MSRWHAIRDARDLNGARSEGHHLRPGKTEGRDKASVCRRHAQRDARDLHSARPEPDRSAPYATMKGHAPIARRRQGVWDAGRGKWRADKIWQGMPGSIGNAGDAGLGHSTGIRSTSEDARVCGGARSAQRRQEAWRRGDNPPHPTTRPRGKKIETVPNLREFFVDINCHRGRAWRLPDPSTAGTACAASGGG